jgi:Tol biopolymer transport system component
VYRARDMRLGRDVAIKVLPAAFVADADRLARFEREARVLAALNHPNIAAIYGVEDGALVLELVEGETLADRIARGPLPVVEALGLARQIAEALDAAHDKGIVHRDVKPANIKITPAGTVKVLDFGLARAVTAHGAAIVGTQIPTVTVGRTQPGAIAGTPGYMSPEQARGQSVDKRTDIWAFGCVTYEMLAGRPAFPGATTSDMMVAILDREPDWNALPATIAPAVCLLLRRCLQKDAGRRLHDIADARIEIDEAIAAPRSSSTVHQSSGRARIVMAVPWAVAAVSLLVALYLAVRLAPREPQRVERPPAQFEMSLPPGVEVFQGSSQEVAFSPTGTHVAFVGNLNGLRQVYVRDLRLLDAIAIRGTENAASCFFSPTGDAVGFITADRRLNKVSLADATVTSVASDADATYFGGTWGSDGRMTFARTNGLWQIPAAGGTPRQITQLQAGESLHAWPAVLNEGKMILFTSVASGGVQRARVDAVEVDTGTRQVIIEGARFARYSPSGHLVFYREGGLHAVSFDAGRMTVTGQPIEVTAAVEQDGSGAPLAEISSAGALVYQRAGVASGGLVWVSRQGIEQSVTDVPRAYLSPHLSADNLRIVVGVGSDLWIQDTLRSTFTRLTSQQSETASYPVWTPDGKQVVFRTPTGLRVIDTDGSGRSRAIAGTTSLDFPSAVSPDGATLAVARPTPDSPADIYVLSLTGDPGPHAVVTGPAFEGGPQFSPDGRWMAYVSNESGQFQVYLRPYPGPDRRWQVSTDGGTSPLWNRSGRELFYRNGNKMMAVFVSTAPDVTLATPRIIFEQPYAYGSTIALTNYDVSADGQRFLMVKRESGVAYLNVVLNWFSELARLAPRADR